MTNPVEVLPPTTTAAASAPLSVRVLRRREVAEGVVALALGPEGGRPLPTWEPGAHVDVVLPNGLIRQYSLCGDQSTHAEYEIAVLREPLGRGGSAFIHDHVNVGDTVTLRCPRNHFALEHAAGYRFVAGGIGITPILPMLAACTASRAPWRLHYGGRTRPSMAFTSLLNLYGTRVTVVPEDEFGFIDFDAAFGDLKAGELVYVCGPGALIAAVTAHAERLGHPESVRCEVFSTDGVEPEPAAAEGTFEVVLARSGMTLTIGPGETILERMLAEGIEVFRDCEEGLCGSCEIPVLEGDVEHHDHVLTSAEREANATMMVCVSRATGSRIVLDV